MENEKNYVAHEMTNVNQTADATDYQKPLETIEQEKNRLTRKLYENISYNENILQILREMIQRTEIYQKKLYFLRDSINQSSKIQMDHVHQLREFLK